MADFGSNRLVNALPPATDYITYLTILEYNVSEENLPLLHNLLQDVTLTINIGWDLVHMLLPLLPASQDCLLTIARLGNPREVLLKVTESLRLLCLDEGIAGEEFESDLDEDVTGHAIEESFRSRRQENRSNEQGHKDAHINKSRTLVAETTYPLVTLQFEQLLSMLSILHPRIKTKFLSRFMSTSLQAILAAFSRSETHLDILTMAVIRFVHAISAMKEPGLSPRISVSHVQSQQSHADAPDPEAQLGFPSPEDVAIQKRLLQAFITHWVEIYMFSMTSEGNVPGLDWASRLQEQLQPEKIVPRRRTSTDSFAHDHKLQSHSSTLGQVVSLAQSLGLDSDELLEAALASSTIDTTSVCAYEEEPPSSPDEVPLSKTGALLLFTAKSASSVLLNPYVPSRSLTVFPDHAKLLRSFIGGQCIDSTRLIGSEPEALIDAILYLALLALENNQIGEPKDDEEFTHYLQTMSLLSANCPSASLRYRAHYTTSTVLRTHPSDLARLAFICDTLEHCPYENLKASAVGWLKGETIEANPPPSAGRHTHDQDHTHIQSNETDTSIFATPVALRTVAPFLFPDLTQTFLSTEDLKDWTTFRMNLSFYLASLNFYYLLLAARHLHGRLNIPSFHLDNNITESFIGPLRHSLKLFGGSLQGDIIAQDERSSGIEAVRMDFLLLEDVLVRVEQGLVELVKASMSGPQSSNAPLWHGLRAEAEQKDNL